MIQNILVFSIALLSSICAFSQVQEESINSKGNEKILQTFFFVDYSLMKIRARHEEASSDSGFESLNDHNDIGVHHFNLKYLIDFVPSPSFSLFITPSLGYMHGENNNRNAGADDNTDYWDSLSGLTYGAQAGISYRFISNNLVIAPYLSAGTISTTLKNFLRFEESETTSSSNEFEQEIKASISEVALGMRFTSLVTNYSSYISIVKYNMTTSSVDGDASTGDSKYTLSEFAEFEMDHLTFQVGFGARF